MAEDGDAVPVPRSLKELWKDPDFEASIHEDKGIVFFARYEEHKKPVRINISMDEWLVSRIDKAAAIGGLTRSGLLAVAALDYLRKTF